MDIALREADRAGQRGEVPVGAVAVLNGRLVARNHNRSLELSDPCAHAEILVLRSAGQILQNYRLKGLELFVTIEPCAMCAGALIWARVSRLVYGAADTKSGAVQSLAHLLEPGRFNHSVDVTSGIRQQQCRQILQEFFATRR
jgi:tRNA(adenine34) deaminase